jgi:hypothetical protein
MPRRKSSRRSARVPDVRAPSIAIVLGLLCAGVAHAEDRSVDAVQAFSKYCLPGPPDFAAIDAKAVAANLVVNKDVKTPLPPGQSAHSKSWHAKLDDGGAYDLVAAEARGPSRNSASCGIGVEGVDRETLKSALVHDLKLSAAATDNASPDGVWHVTAWKYGADMMLVLTDGTAPMGIPGLYLSLVAQKNSSR